MMQKQKNLKLTADDYRRLDEAARKFGVKKTWLVMALLDMYKKEKKQRFSNGNLGNDGYGKDFW